VVKDQESPKTYHSGWFEKAHLDGVEQFHDHGRDTSEEQRTTATFHFASIPFDLDEGPSLPFDVLYDPRWIHVLRYGKEQGVNTADLFQLAYILFYRPRISGEVLVWCKLGGVDEDRYDRRVVRFFRVLDEAEMSGMQCAHRGDKSDRFVVIPKL
jgi:hypothetical protein